MVNGECKCINPIQVLYEGQCHNPLTCPPNSYFNPLTYSCLCNQGYRLVNNNCLSITCGPNSHNLNGICICNPGYYMINGQCKSCGNNEIFNGIECICLNGYSRNNYGICVNVTVPICGDNMVYSHV